LLDPFIFKYAICYRFINISLVDYNHNATELYSRSLHDALPIYSVAHKAGSPGVLAVPLDFGDEASILDCVRTGAEHFGNLWGVVDRKSTRLNSSHVKKSYAVIFLKKKHIIDKYIINTRLLDELM